MERDLLQIRDLTLAEAASFNLASGDVLRRKLEGKKLERDQWIKDLEKEVGALQKKLEEEQAAQKEANRAPSKAKVLGREREGHEKEMNAFASRSREVMQLYRDCLLGAGTDTEFPEECTMDEFMVWLQGEMDALDSHMMLGHDFAAITAFKRKLSAKGFFDEFWHAGGNKMAIMQVACSRGQDAEEKKAIMDMVLEFLTEKRRQEATKAAADGDSASPAASPNLAAKSSAARVARANIEDRVDA
ncbi:uncharacterized protein [Miscanthus floridulus]|uniref:uncharacterized protein isoform X2 n=1 Tax=Miscanthus floridulus TaxID=154761 RepID=UPI00345AA2E2